VFSLCALAAAVEGRRWGLVLFGVLLIFSKEPGVLLYGAIAAVWMWRRYAAFMSPDDASRIGIAALVFLGFLSLIDGEVPSALFLLSAAAIVAHRPLQPALPPRKGLVRAVLQDWPLALPVLLLVAYLAAYAMRSATGADGAPGKPLVWGGGGGALALVDALLRGGVFDPPTRSSLALMFVVGFLWVPSLWTLADLVVGAIRHVRNAPPRQLFGVDRSALGFIVVVLIADVWLLSRFVTYSNARYYLPVFPLGLLAAYGALVRLRVPALPRAGLLASAAVLLAVSTVRTVDPVSRAIWGTFEVGDRSLLSVTSLRKECCGHGRDQLAYNLEFTQFATLQDLLYERLKPQGAVLVVPEYGDWFVVERLDSATHRRTMRADGSYVPTVLEAQKAQDLDAPTAWYVEMPYIKDTTFRAMLAKSYEFTEPCRVSHDGYALTAYAMRLRPKTLVSQSSAVRDRRCLPGAPSRPTPVLSIR
jgi:hypothetical protein